MIDNLVKEIQDDECLIFFVRHGDHGKEGKIKNQLTTEAVAIARKFGQLLVEQNIKISAAVSSPQFRAIDTVAQILISMGTLLPINTDEGLGDFAMDPRITAKDVDRLKAKAKTTGNLIEACLLKDTELKRIVIFRGRVGADSLRNFASHHPGKIVIAASHGGSRIEPTVAYLENQNFDPAEIPVTDLAPTNGIIALIINSKTTELVKKINLFHLF